MSNLNILDDIKKLEFKRGDTLILGPQFVRWLSAVPALTRQRFQDSLNKWTEELGFELPVIIGDATKMSREDLVRMLENAPE